MNTIEYNCKAYYSHQICMHKCVISSESKNPKAQLSRFPHWQYNPPQATDTNVMLLFCLYFMCTCLLGPTAASLWIR